MFRHFYSRVFRGFVKWCYGESYEYCGVEPNRDLEELDEESDEDDPSYRSGLEEVQDDVHPDEYTDDDKEESIEDDPRYYEGLDELHDDVHPDEYTDDDKEESIEDEQLGQNTKQLEIEFQRFKASPADSLIRGGKYESIR